MSGGSGGDGYRVSAAGPLPIFCRCRPHGPWPLAVPQDTCPYPVTTQESTRSLYCSYTILMLHCPLGRKPPFSLSFLPPFSLPAHRS